MNNKVACLLKKELDDLDIRKKTLLEHNNQLLVKKQQLNSKLDKLKYKQKNVSTEFFDTMNKINSNYKKYNDLEDTYKIKLVMYENEKAKFFTSNVNQEIKDIFDCEDTENSTPIAVQIQVTAQLDTPPSNSNNFKSKPNVNNQVIETITTNNNFLIESNASTIIEDISTNTDKDKMKKFINEPSNRNIPTKKVNDEVSLFVNKNCDKQINNVSITNVSINNNANSRSNSNKENSILSTPIKRIRDPNGIYYYFIL
jgi:hypothetical protein